MAHTLLRGSPSPYQDYSVSVQCEQVEHDQGPQHYPGPTCAGQSLSFHERHGSHKEMQGELELGLQMHLGRRQLKSTSFFQEPMSSRSYYGIGKRLYKDYGVLTAYIRLSMTPYILFFACSTFHSYCA